MFRVTERRCSVPISGNDGSWPLAIIQPSGTLFCRTATNRSRMSGSDPKRLFNRNYIKGAAAVSRTCRGNLD